jgi:hypothetical protein
MINSAIESAGKIAILDGIRYRVLVASQDIVPLCRMDITKLDIQYIPISEYERMVRNQEIQFEDEVPLIFSHESIPMDAYNEFLNRCNIVHKITEYYGPTYVELLGKKPKRLLQQIAAEQGCTINVLWKWIRIYLQSGCSDVALIDKRFSAAPKSNEQKQYNYTVKTGRPTEGGIASGIVVNDVVRSQFLEFLEEYKRGREQTYKNAYIGLICKYYSRIVPDEMQRQILPISERPTYEQFYRFCKKHISQEENDAIKTSRAEQRNNRRILTASTREDAIRPGSIVEVDAWEADCSIVSILNPEQCIGRPIVYFMVDIYSKAIVAMSVSLENNSLQGITNLLINLGEDKQKYAIKYGIASFDPALWPSNFIPHEIRCDRGAEFRSEKFGKICNRLGIMRSLEPPGMGSMKGLVEQCFHQLNASIRTELEGNGLITKRHDSNHHREAMLTLVDFTRMVITFVITHNQKYMTTFLPSKEMLEHKGFKPTPASLWSYGCEKYGLPKIITEATRNQYFFDLLPEKIASINKQGIMLNDLNYCTNDSVLLKDMYDTQGKRIKFPVRIDPQDVEHIYYMRNNTLCVATLNSGFPEQMSYAGLTWQQFEEYKKVIRQMKKDGDSHNLQIAADRRIINQSIISGATTDHLADTSDIRNARKTERYLTNNENRIIARLSDECVPERLQEQITLRDESPSVTEDEF